MKKQKKNENASEEDGALFLTNRLFFRSDIDTRQK